MSSLSIEDQVKAIRVIMKTPTCDYLFKGNTFPHKEELLMSGATWCEQNGCWKFRSIDENHSIYKKFNGLKGTWWERA